MGRRIGGTLVQQCKRVLDDILAREFTRLDETLQDNPAEQDRRKDLLTRWRVGIVKNCEARFGLEVAGVTQTKDWRRFLYTLLSILNREDEGLSILTQDSPSEVDEDYDPDKLQDRIGDGSEFPAWVSDCLHLSIEGAIRRQNSLNVVMDRVTKFLLNGKYMSIEEVNEWRKKMQELPFKQWNDGEWQELLDLMNELKKLLDSNKIFSSVLIWGRQFRYQWTPEALVQRAKARKEQKIHEREVVRLRGGRNRFHIGSRRH